jgi:HPt (histidine-containing phosphotransfer) domain-containing protein
VRNAIISITPLHIRREGMATASPLHQRKLKILLLRPGDRDATGTEERLIAAGHCVNSAADAQDAARLLRTRPVNLVLLEGHKSSAVLEVVSILRGQNGRLSTRYTPIFLIASASAPLATHSAHLDGVVTAPINCDALVSAYAAFLSASLNQVHQTSEAPRSCEIDAAIDRLGGDVELYKDLAARFLDDTAGTRRALETAYERRDAASLHRAAHSLKGLAASVGAVTVAGVLGELEALGRTANLDQMSAVWQRFQNEMATAADQLAIYHRACFSAHLHLA